MINLLQALWRSGVQYDSASASFAVDTEDLHRVELAQQQVYEEEQPFTQARLAAARFDQARVIRSRNFDDF